MLNVILADDEPMIIRGLKKLIPWEELGIRIVGEAWTGKGLLELVEREHPELVVTDISMPDGSGIDVIKEIARRKLRTKVIFISAYQEFSYAKDALAFGAVDYLVKPVEKRLLREAVQRAVSLLQEETEEMTSMGKLAAYELKDKQTQLEDLFDRLTEGDIREEEAKRQLERLEAGYVYECYTAFVIEPEPFQEGQATWGEHEKRLLFFAVSNLTGELARSCGNGLVLRKADSLCVITNHREDSDMLELGQEMVEKVRFYLKTNITLGIGRPACSLQEIKSSYLSAADALKLRYFTGQGRVIHWQAASDLQRASERDSMQGALTEVRQQLLQALLSKEMNVIAQAADQALNRIEAAAQGSKEAAVTGCYQLLAELSEELAAVGVAYVPAEQDQLQSMHRFGRYAELKQYVEGEITEIFGRMQSSGSGKEVQQMTLVKEYIENHYSENITLERIASLVYMNPYYFSSFFKKHTNRNFKQYVTEVRMKHAVRLLLQTDLMVYEIAEKVGYNNARQFSDMFKKQYGKLPQDYKNHKN
ncbi:response regulator [Paenibacillus chartarius]|uniref:Response regulator n=1 Tax=Paenibacillus chartarius TaxID=747481 RepID=A0ABV6DH20_9BACL